MGRTGAGLSGGRVNLGDSTVRVEGILFKGVFLMGENTRPLGAVFDI